MPIEMSQSATERLRSLPNVTDRVRAARSSSTEWRRLGEDVYPVIIKRMTKWLICEGLFRANIEIDDLFAAVWSGRMRKSIHSIEFHDREHFVNTFCKNVVWAARDQVAKHRRSQKKLLPESIADPRPTPDDLASWAELLQRLDEAIASLPDELRSPIRGHLEGKTLRQMAPELKLSASGVKGRLDKAQAQLSLLMHR